jgi:hypothetical protein
VTVYIAAGYPDLARARRRLVGAEEEAGRLRVELAAARQEAAQAQTKYRQLLAAVGPLLAEHPELLTPPDPAA